jgi:hypothetical protein
MFAAFGLCDDCLRHFRVVGVFEFRNCEQEDINLARADGVLLLRDRFIDGQVAVHVLEL